MMEHIADSMAVATQSKVRHDARYIQRQDRRLLTMGQCSRGPVPPAEQGRDSQRRRADCRVQLRGHMYDPGTDKSAP